MAALSNDAATGYEAVSDWEDATPQPDYDDAGAALNDPTEYTSFLWPVYALLYEGVDKTPVGEGGSQESWGVIR